LKLFRDIIQLQPIKHVLPLATSAVREASNKEEFLRDANQETGFKFKVLSEKEEALYSYAGAIKSLQLPNVLFFDLGGGSLEMVRAEKYKIKKIISLPLGALRLTQSYDEKDGAFSPKNYKNMKRHIWNLLPSRKELDLNQDTMFVGVGGSLRAIARYHQKIGKYPLDKIHNYEMNYKSVKEIARKLSKMRADDIDKISVIGSSRTETIVAGSCVINTVMEKLELKQVCVSNHGLREGALSIFLENEKAFHGSITVEQIRQSVVAKEARMITNGEDFVKGLLTSKLISKREYIILLYALKKISEKASYNNPLSWFYSVLDQDMILSHSEQLVLGLSLVHARHAKTSEWLFTRYKSILTPQDKASIKKISSVVTLLKVLTQIKAKIELRSRG